MPSVHYQSHPCPRRSRIETSALAAAVSALCLAAAAFPLRVARPAGHVWRDTSFAEFAAGTFDAGGANLYVSRAGRLQTVHRWDFNDDGFCDLLFNSTHDMAYRLPAALFAGSRRGLNARPAVELPTDGGAAAHAGDLDGDGFRDLLLINGLNRAHRATGAFVYWGRRSGLDPERPTALWKNTEIRAAAVGRLPGGRGDAVALSVGGTLKLVPALRSPEITRDLGIRGVTSVAFDGSFVFAVTGGTVRRLRLDADGAAETGPLPGEGVQRVFVANMDGDGRRDLLYGRGDRDLQWLPDGRPEGTPRTLPASAPAGVVVVDLDRDGRPDLAAASGGRIAILMGRAGGFERADDLPARSAAALATGDWNGGGWPDLAVANGHGPDPYETDSWIYWGSAAGFSGARRSAFRTAGAVDLLSGDFTGDWIDDLRVVNAVGGRLRGDVPAMIYWGSRRGSFAASRRPELPTVGAYQSSHADLNDDGWPDLILCRFFEPWTQDHHVPSYVYWGSARLRAGTPHRARDDRLPRRRGGGSEPRRLPGSRLLEPHESWQLCRAVADLLGQPRGVRWRARDASAYHRPASDGDDGHGPPPDTRVRGAVHVALQQAVALDDGGADGLTVWDANSAADRADQWSVVSRLGHVEELRERAQQEAPDSPSGGAPVTLRFHRRGDLVVDGAYGTNWGF